MLPKKRERIEKSVARKKGLLFPNEHGAWVMLFTAFLIGWLATPAFSWKPLLLLPAAVGAFLARYPLGLYFKKRKMMKALHLSLQHEIKSFVVYGILTLLTAAPLFLIYHWWWLLLFAAFSGLAFIGHLRPLILKKERPLSVELFGMAGMTVMTPAAAYTARSHFNVEPLLLWLLVTLFFGWRVVAVRRQVEHRKEKPVNLKQVGRNELIYSLIFALITVGFAKIFHSIEMF